MYLSIGYPIGVTETDKGRYYTIETSDKYIHLGGEDVGVWAKINSKYSPKSQEDIEIVRRLEAAGAVAFADSVGEMINFLMSHRYIRQGFGMLNEAGHCVHVGNRVVNLNNRQMALWQAGNGKTTIRDLVELSHKRKTLSFDELLAIYYDFLFLIDNDLVYVI